MWILIIAVLIALFLWGVGFNPWDSIRERHLQKSWQRKEDGRDCERAKKNEAVLCSDVFKNLEKRVFCQTNVFPAEISWGKGRDIAVYRAVDIKVDFVINASEVPDEIEFMRALNYKYGDHYYYEEFSYSEIASTNNHGEYFDKSQVEWIRMRLKPIPIQKVNPHW